MGNKTSSCAVSNKEEELSDYDMTIYNLKKERIFWGTLAICITYAVIAFILFIASYLSEKVKAILLNRFFPFTLVFVIGTIAITIYLTYQVLDFRPVKINKNNNYDTLSCPDYWRLEKVPIDETNPSDTQLFEGTNPGLFKYRCVMDPAIFNKVDLAKSAKSRTVNGVPKADLRLTGVSKINDVVLPIDNETKNASYSNNYLYANLVEKNNIYYKDIANSNLPQTELLKHNFIMNNYTLITSNDTSGLLKFRYNIDSSKMDTARKLNIYPLNSYDNDITNTTYNPFNVMANKFMSVEIEPTYKVHLVKTGTTETSIDAPTTNVPMACDRVYPLYLATKDVELSKGNSKLDQNVLRCAYSKICGVPWSDLNCEKYMYK